MRGLSLVALIVVVFSLSACGGDDADIDAACDAARQWANAGRDESVMPAMAAFARNAPSGEVPTEQLSDLAALEPSASFEDAMEAAGVSGDEEWQSEIVEPTNAWVQEHCGIDGVLD